MNTDTMQDKIATIVKIMSELGEEAGGEDTDFARGQCYGIAQAADILALAGVITAEQSVQIKGY